MRRFCIILLSYLLVTLSLQVSASERASVLQRTLERNAAIRYGRLDNGMNYYIWPNKAPRGEAVYRLWVRSGSLNEEYDQLGVAHFIEHMAFNGSAHFPGNRMVRFLESQGAKFGKDLNAHTSFDETVYKLQLPSKDPAIVDSTLLIMADWAYGLTFDPEEVEKERGVILSEWLARRNKGVNTNDTFLQVLFEGSQYALRPTIGDTAIIAHTTPELLRRYYETWYRPHLMGIAVVGDVDPDQVERSICRLFGSWSPISHGIRLRPNFWLTANKKREATIATSPGEKMQLDIVLKLPPSGAIQTEEDMRAYVVNKVAHALIKSRMSAYTFVDAGFSDASMGRSSVVRGGDFWLASATLNKDSLWQGIAQFEARRRQVFRYGFCTPEIQREARRILNKARREAQDKTPRTSSKLMDELYNDYMRQMCCIDPQQELSYLERFVPEVDSLTLLKYLKNFDQPKHEHWFLHGDSTLLKQVPDETTLLRYARKIGSGPKPQRWYVPTVAADSLMSCPRLTATHLVHTDTISEIGAVRWQMDNGCDVIYRQSSQDSEKLLLTGFREGGLYHLDSTLYRAGVMASAIIPMCGAGALSNEALKEYLEGSSVSVKMLMDKNRTGVAGHARNCDADQLMQLLYTKWNGPRVDSAVFHRILLELKDSLQTTPEMMLEAFGQMYGSVDGYHFILIGDMPADSVLHLCDKWLGALPSGRKEYHLVHEVTRPLTADTLILERTDKERATVTMVWEGALDPGQEGFSLYQHQMMGDLRKGVMTSVLRQVLREDMGITYSVAVTASSAVVPVPMWRDGVACACLPANTDTVLAVVRQQMQLLVDDPESMRETLEDVKQNLIKTHGQHLQQNTWWSGYIRNVIYNNEPSWTYADDYSRIVSSVSPQQVAEGIREMLASPCKIKIQSNRQ